MASLRCTFVNNKRPINHSAKQVFSKDPNFGIHEVERFVEGWDSPIPKRSAVTLPEWRQFAFLAQVRTEVSRMLAKEIRIRNRRFSALIESTLVLAIVSQLIVGAVALKVQADESLLAEAQQKAEAAAATTSEKLAPPVTSRNSNVLSSVEQASVKTPPIVRVSSLR